MVFSNLNFAKLHALLLELGFVERTLDGKYLSYLHASSDTFFVFRNYDRDDKVSEADLVSVRKQLDWRGLLSEEAFEASLFKASA